MVNLKKVKEKVEYNSPVILTFIIICCALCIANYVTLGLVNNLLALRKLLSIQLVTHIFVHGDINHLTNNMLVILLVGPMVESKYGSGRTAMMILITSVIIGVLTVSIFHVGLLGASGIAYMILALSACSNIKNNKIPASALILLLFIVVSQILSAIFVRDNVSQGAHIIGLFMGVAWAFIYKNID